MFIFDRCHHSWAAETPDKYERNLKYLTYVFDKSKFPVTEKSTNGALVIVTPAPEWVSGLILGLCPANERHVTK